MEIKQTYNYDQFKPILGNRNVSKVKVENIVKDIEQGLNLLPYCPIIVFAKDDNFMIIDGQHRFEASITTKNPVNYVVCDELDLKQIASINSKASNWKAKDYLNCYVNIGLKDYIVLRDFIKEYRITYSTAISLLMNGKVLMGGSNYMDKFKEGIFVVNYLDKATEVVSTTISIFNLYVFNRDRHLIGAMQDIIEKGKCDLDVLKSKIKMAPNEMDKNSSKKDYIYNIERVYNYKNSKRVTIW